MPTISLCMIVKNEERLLPQCLKSVKDYVDEIVVVDTGSSDRTVEIARGFGARVYHHPWEGNFSKHRNQSIGYASGDWVFILDADEEIISPSGALIRKAVLDKEIDSVDVLVHNVYNRGKSISLQQGIRIFRNHCGIQYVGRVHNRMVGAKRSRLYPIKVLHHGYDLDVKKAERKFHRTTELLKKEIDDDPENPIHHHYLAASYLCAPMYEAAAGESLKALSLVEKNGSTQDPFYSWTYYIAGKALYELDRLDHAEEISLKGLGMFPGELDIYYNLVNIYFKKGDGEKLAKFARRYFELKQEIEEHPDQFAHIHVVSFNEAWRVRLMLGLSLLNAGEHKEAEIELGQAKELTNSRGVYYHELGRYYLKKKEYDLADKHLRSAFDQDKNQIDVIYSFIELAITRKDESSELFWWKRLLELFPKKREKMIEQARIAIDEHRLADARKLLKALLAKMPADEDALRLMVEYIEEKDDVTDEVAYLRELLPMARNKTDLVMRVGLLLLRKGYPGDACDFLKKAVRSKPDEPAGHLGLAAVYWRQGEVELCVAELDQVLQLFDSPCKKEIATIEEIGAIFALIGGKLLSKGDMDAAIAAYGMSLEMNCHLPHVYQGLAKASQNTGRLKKSLDYLRTSLKLSPNTNEVLWQMGDVYRLMGNMKAAEFCYHKSQSMDKTSD